jgi:hypothetical protein
MLAGLDGAVDRGRGGACGWGAGWKNGKNWAETGPALKHSAKAIVTTWRMGVAANMAEWSARKRDMI